MISIAWLLLGTRITSIALLGNTVQTFTVNLLTEIIFLPLSILTFRYVRVARLADCLVTHGGTKVLSLLLTDSRGLVPCPRHGVSCPKQSENIPGFCFSRQDS